MGYSTHLTIADHTQYKMSAHISAPEKNAQCVSDLFQFGDILTRLAGIQMEGVMIEA